MVYLYIYVFVQVSQHSFSNFLLKHNHNTLYQRPSLVMMQRKITHLTRFSMAGRWHNGVLVFSSAKLAVQPGMVCLLVLPTGLSKCHAMYYFVHAIMHVKDPQLSVMRVWNCVLLAGFCLSLYSLHMLKRDVDKIQMNNNKFVQIKWPLPK